MHRCANTNSAVVWSYRPECPASGVDTLFMPDALVAGGTTVSESLENVE
jgi:hypothetical protein